MVLRHSVTINKTIISRDNALFPQQGIDAPEQLYTALGCSYPRFYKMDALCKWAFVAAEYLFGKDTSLYSGLDKSKISVALTTSHGCLEVDRRYAATMAMPSPALFVYTLPNIMLGELCIRHGFKGEQSCMLSEQPDTGELFFNVHRLLGQAGMEACLCGWADVTAASHAVCLFWVTKGRDGIPFTMDNLRHLFDTQNGL